MQSARTLTGASPLPLVCASLHLFFAYLLFIAFREPTAAGGFCAGATADLQPRLPLPEERGCGAGRGEPALCASSAGGTELPSDPRTGFYQFREEGELSSGIVWCCVDTYRTAAAVSLRSTPSSWATQCCTTSYRHCATVLYWRAMPLWSGETWTACPGEFSCMCGLCVLISLSFLYLCCLFRVEFAWQDPQRKLAECRSVAISVAPLGRCGASRSGKRAQSVEDAFLFDSHSHQADETLPSPH